MKYSYVYLPYFLEIAYTSSKTIDLYHTAYPQFHAHSSINCDWIHNFQPYKICIQIFFSNHLV